MAVGMAVRMAISMAVSMAPLQLCRFEHVAFLLSFNTRTFGDACVPSSVGN